MNTYVLNISTITRLKNLQAELLNVINTEEEYDASEDEDAEIDFRFDQEDCSNCVIGSGIRAGIMNGFTDFRSEQAFNDAVAWLNLPIIKYSGSRAQAFINNSYFRDNVLADYMFGGCHTIESSGGYLNMPEVSIHSSFNAQDAFERIQTVLDGSA